MSTSRFVRVRDRHLSLWQSAVAEFVRGQLGAADSPVSTNAVLAHPMTQAVNEHVQLAIQKQAVPEASPDESDLHRLYVHLSHLAFQKGQALVEGDLERAEALDVEFRKYSDKDPGFLTCPLTYAKYYKTYGGIFAYNDWTIQGNGNINYGVIPWTLPNDATVAIIGDWGTGLNDAISLLEDVVANHHPAAIIHLGDIYYSGTPGECQTNYAGIFPQVWAQKNDGVAIPVFTLAGNHDYYAAGYGFYQTFSTLNSGISGATQPASYFCLRTADGGWQFLAMDTGFYDSNPADQVDTFYAGPKLHGSEVAWLQDKLDAFAGATILLSHHQLFSANAKLNGSFSPYGDLPYMNPYLYSATMQYFPDKVAAWLWGHEHNFVLYQNNLFGLAKGRLIGCSAYEELESANPYAVNYPQVPYLDPNAYRLGADQGYYNHGYAIIDLSGRSQPTDPVSITYYQYPSWGDTAPSNPTSSVIYQEELAKPTAPPVSPVTYGSPIQLFAQEGLYVAPLYQQTQYYPTLSTSGAVTLEIDGGSGPIMHGDQVTIKTRESAAGSYDVLGAWSTPTLYYYSPGYSQQNWTIQKKDAGDPEVHYGDEVCFVNDYYPGHWLMPYWSRLYTSIYLTTQPAANYYWVIRPPVVSAEAATSEPAVSAQWAVLGSNQ